MPTSDRTPIAFVFPAFPVLHQTFVLWEVLSLRQLGVPIRLYSLKHPSTRTQQPEGAALAQEVRYLPALSRAVLKDNARVLARNPKRYVGVFLRLVREWWRDRHVKELSRDPGAQPDPAERLLTLGERIQGFLNENPFVYLLRSLALVLPAVHLGVELQREGIMRVHAHWASYPTTAALVIQWLFDIPFSFTAHAYDIYLVPRLLPVKVRTAEFVVTCAQVNAAFLRQLGGPATHDRVVVNYHGVDLNRFAPRPARAPEGEPRIVTCGRLQIYKGHHVLLRACAKLSRPVRCIIVGEGPQRAKLEELARSLGIADRVEFTGALPQTELVRHYREAALFVLASIVVTSYGRRDVIPNVLAEAMAMQVPVVSTNISGIRELITDRETGRLVAPGDPDALARAVDELLDDPGQREHLALAGYQKVLAEFDRAANVRVLAELFGGQCGGEGPPAPVDADHRP
jgi:colanic acid/amylovoran biosynthesis glycosyltransferase